MDDVLINDDQSYSYSKIDNLCKKIQQQADTNVFLQADIDTGIGITAKKHRAKRFSLEVENRLHHWKKCRNRGL